MGAPVRRGPIALLLGLVLISACRSVDADGLMARGNQYFTQERFQEASIEFRRVLQQDPGNGMAHLRLADTYLKLKDLQHAAVEYVLAAREMPEHLEAQLSAGDMLLLGGRFNEAQAMARRAMLIDPRNVRALVINAQALAGLKRHDQAMVAIERAMQLDPSRVQTLGTVGAIQLGRASPEQSEETFKKMVDLDPESVDARLTLASFYWVQARVLEAEVQLQAALRLDPAHVAANRAMATFYLGTGRTREAETYLIAAVEGLDTTAARLMLGDYYLSLGRTTDAERVFIDAAKRPDGFGEARSRLAVIAYDSGRTTDGHRLVEETLKSDPSNARALLTKAGFLLSEGRTDRAFQVATAARDADPTAVAPRYMLASIHRTRREFELAERLYNEILQLNPRSAAAQLELANLEIARGSLDTATLAANLAVRSRPENVEAQAMLLRGLIAGGDLARAEGVLKPLLSEHGDRASVQWLAGVLHLRRGNGGSARTHFERALVIQPDALEPLDALTALDLEANRVDAARARVEQRLRVTPRSVGLLILAARVYAFAKDAPAAERALKTALEAAPNEPSIYDELARHFLADKQADRAIREFEALAKQYPQSVGPPTLLGVILAALNRPFEAQSWFEKGLALDPRNAVIANSLAWLYADQGGDLDAALKLALIAKQQIADRPEIDDTLGWVYYMRGEIGRALPILRSTVERDPGNAMYQYHLGLAHAKAGNTSQARDALQRALKNNPRFPGASNARAVLGTLK